MKKTILILSLLPVAFLSCNNSTTEKQVTNNQIKNEKNMQVTEEQKKGILHAIDLYIEAGNKGDGKIAKEAFVTTATVSWVENGKLKSSPIQVLYDFFDQGALESSYELTSINIAEDIATVRIESQFGTAKFADMFAMVKDGDKWKIVSKVYHAK
ncbi:nuclear transport factor 2 family protein [Flavobacterium pectinovorum]|uniref:nuclear transport factor 2 family protein n=1 Tax=Flavobacterium pectinovorum TaxID=29533 RepID=UPI001FAD863C|nr:nuclear transport factor 2 family protein [Flavobacterium pectinovorum]MCI9844574.1 nuclear transport factor 2 family protein [Flavobacterium pectinovorum]